MPDFYHSTGFPWRIVIIVLSIVVGLALTRDRRYAPNAKRVTPIGVAGFCIGMMIEAVRRILS